MGFYKSNDYTFISPVDCVVFRPKIAVPGKRGLRTVFGSRGETTFVCMEKGPAYRCAFAKRFGFKYGFVVTKLK